MALFGRFSRPAPRLLPRVPRGGLGRGSALPSFAAHAHSTARAAFGCPPVSLRSPAHSRRSGVPPALWSFALCAPRRRTITWSPLRGRHGGSLVSGVPPAPALTPCASFRSVLGGTSHPPSPPVPGGSSHTLSPPRPVSGSPGGSRRHALGATPRYGSPSRKKRCIFYKRKKNQKRKDDAYLAAVVVLFLRYCSVKSKSIPPYIASSSKTKHQTSDNNNNFLSKSVEILCISGLKIARRIYNTVVFLVSWQLFLGRKLVNFLLMNDKAKVQRQALYIA